MTPSGVLGGTTTSPPVFSLTGLPDDSTGKAPSSAGADSFTALLGPPSAAVLLWTSVEGASAATVPFETLAGVEELAGALSSS